MSIFCCWMACGGLWWVGGLTFDGCGRRAGRQTDRRVQEQANVCARAMDLWQQASRVSVCVCVHACRSTYGNGRDDACPGWVVLAAREAVLELCCHQKKNITCVSSCVKTSVYMRGRDGRKGGRKGGREYGREGVRGEEARYRAGRTYDPTPRSGAGYPSSVSRS